MRFLTGPVARLAAFAVGLSQATVCLATTLALYSYYNPLVPGEEASVRATVTGNAPPLGTVKFLDNGADTPSCGNLFLQGNGNTRGITCYLQALTPGSHVITATYSGDGVNPPAQATLVQRVTATKPSSGTVVYNPYGAMSVVGATMSGNTIGQFQDWVEIHLGSIAGPPGEAFEIEFQSFDLDHNTFVQFVSGAPGQTVVLRVTGSAPSAIAGLLAANPGGSPFPDIAAPTLHFHNRNGISTNVFGYISGPHVILDTLGASWMEGSPVVNGGVIYATRSEIMAGQITGTGKFYANDLTLRSFGNMNAPIYDAQFYFNGLSVRQANTTLPVDVTLNPYGTGPQVVNVSVWSDATFSMPSAWPAGSTAPPNHQPVLPGSSLPVGANPLNGGGSLIVHANGALRLVGGDTMDFAFPGAMVIRSDTSIDLAGVVVNQGWTSSGQTMQGMFFEAPTIESTIPPIRAYSNDRNWINFSTLPRTPVRAFDLVRNVDGSASFVAADATAPHLNSYFAIVNANAEGKCWTCLINPLPIDVYGP